MLVTRCIFVAGMIAASSIAAYPHRGASIFESQGCIQCHSVNGRGGKTAPDLGRRIGRGYTPATLAAAIWNHAPRMWQGMEQAGSSKRPLESG